MDTTDRDARVIRAVAGTRIGKYVAELRERVASQRSQRATFSGHSTGQSSRDLGLYYVLKDPAESSPRITEDEASTLAGPWTPPSAYGRDDHPVANAQNGLISFNRYKSTGDQRFLDRARAAADHLLELQHPDGSWWYMFDFIDLTSGWTSAMAQGQGISLLLRVYQATNDARYLNSATRALEYTMKPIEDGGNMGQYEDGTPFLEEYPGSDVSPNTLNGAIFALWGIRDYGLVTGDRKWIEQFGSLADGIAAHLPLYDTGDWTFYSLRADRTHRADMTYHVVHIVQARVMSKITEDLRWKNARKLWEGYYYDQIGGRNAIDVWWRDVKRRVRARRATSG